MVFLPTEVIHCLEESKCLEVSSPDEHKTLGATRWVAQIKAGQLIEVRVIDVSQTK